MVRQVPRATVLDIFNDNRTYAEIAQAYAVNIHTVGNIKCGLTHRTTTNYEAPMHRRNGMRGRKLTPDQARAVAASTLSAQQLADEYGVSRSLVEKIKSGQTYRSEVTRINHAENTNSKRDRLPPLPENIPVKERLRITLDEFFK